MNDSIDFDPNDLDLEEDLEKAKFQYWLNKELRIQTKESGIRIINYIKKTEKTILDLKMNIILSIKPKYVEKIIERSKKYEFRKKIFKKKNISKIYIYCSYPIKRIIGYFEIGGIIEDSPINLWNKYKEHSGLTEKEFFSYYEGKTIGYAIKIKNLKVFEDHLNPFELFPDFKAPQSFCYFEGEL
jgi:type I restriction enzyme S subunit